MSTVVAEEGGSPEFVDLHGNTEVSAMPPCSGDPLGTIHRGCPADHQQVRKHGHAHGGVMGITAGWVAQD
ncbi:hypothetical protein [Streptomyces sp. AS02]|uniref:hypothetical protein n=1 Tax=Streptomyces sp. AS02 TaxID=2938946 RepID=UPI00202203C9|nr:hypothetical protein [Streptomyces sp. AS02]MCL8012155.1 hypothetical protein [Streptomyces sp. AS02]